MSVWLLIVVGVCCGRYGDASIDYLRAVSFKTEAACRKSGEDTASRRAKFVCVEINPLKTQEQ